MKARNVTAAFKVGHHHFCTDKMIDKESTTIVNGAGKKEDIEGRVAQIKAEIEETTSDYVREKLQERRRSRVF